MKIKIISADETKIRELENGSAFTWEGLSSLENDKEVILDCFIIFVSIPLNMFKNIGKLAILKLQFGARWLDDIVDNNARRELEE